MHKGRTFEIDAINSFLLIFLIFLFLLIGSTSILQWDKGEADDLNGNQLSEGQV